MGGVREVRWGMGGGGGGGGGGEAPPKKNPSLLVTPLTGC